MVDNQLIGDWKLGLFWGGKNGGSGATASVTVAVTPGETLEIIPSLLPPLHVHYSPLVIQK